MNDEQPTPTQETIGTGLAAVLGTVMGGPMGGVIGAAAGPPLTQLVRRAWQELVSFRERQLENVIEHSANFAEVPPETLVETMQQDPAQHRLLHDALLAAADARDQDKIEALARCLANGFEDPARVDDEALLVRALADLDPVHVRVLAQLERGNMSASRVRRFLAGEGLSREEYRISTDLSAPVLNVLERNGLASGLDELVDLTGTGTSGQRQAIQTVYKCTDFGRECLKRLGNNNRRLTPAERPKRKLPRAV